MKPATDKALQQLVIEMQIAEIQAAADHAFRSRQIRRKVAHGRAPMMCNDVLILPIARKNP